MNIEDGSLGTPRARQLRAMGHDAARGGLMPEEIQDKVIEQLTDWIGSYREPLGSGVYRTLRLLDTDEESVTFEVRLNRSREPGKRYRLKVDLKEISNDAG
jgi:hypothetical protein